MTSYYLQALPLLPQTQLLVLHPQPPPPQRLHLQLHLLPRRLQSHQLLQRPVVLLPLQQQQPRPLLVPWLLHLPVSYCLNLVSVSGAAWSVCENFNHQFFQNFLFHRELKFFSNSLPSSPSPPPPSPAPSGGPHRQEVPGRRSCPQAPCAGARVSRERPGPTSLWCDKENAFGSLPVLRRPPLKERVHSHQSFSINDNKSLICLLHSFPSFSTVIFRMMLIYTAYELND